MAPDMESSVSPVGMVSSIAHDVISPPVMLGDNIAMAVLFTSVKL